MDEPRKHNADDFDHLLERLFEETSPKVGDIRDAERRFIQAFEECREEQTGRGRRPRLARWAYVAVAASLLATVVFVRLEYDSSTADSPAGPEMAVSTGVDATQQPMVVTIEPNRGDTLTVTPKETDLPASGRNAATPDRTTMSVAGLVLSPSGVPASGPLVTYQSIATPDLGGTVATESGRFTIEGLPSGEYSIAAQSEDFLGGRAVIAPGDNDLILNLSERGQLAVKTTGSTTDEDGGRGQSSEPLAGALVSLRSRPGAGDFVAMEGVSDASGEVLFERLPRGAYLIAAKFSWQDSEEPAATSSVDMTFSKQDVTMMASPGIAATAKLIQSLSDAPAGYAGQVTMSCRYQQPPIGSREYASSYTGFMFNNPSRQPYVAATDKEIEAWIDKVSEPYEEEFLAVMSWMHGAFGFRLFSGERPLPVLQRNEYFGHDGATQVYWLEEGNDCAFVAHSRDDGLIGGQTRDTVPKTHVFLHPMDWFGERGLLLNASQDEAGSWILQGVAAEETGSIASVWLKTDADNREVVREIRYVCRTPDGVHNVVEALLAEQTQIKGVAFPRKVTWTRRRLRWSMSTPDLLKPLEFDAKTDERFYLDFVSAEYGNAQELFPSGTLLPTPPDDRG